MPDKERAVPYSNASNVALMRGGPAGFRAVPRAFSPRFAGFVAPRLSPGGARNDDAAVVQKPSGLPAGTRSTPAAGIGPAENPIRRCVMNHDEIPTPRAAIGIAAAVMVALTLGVAVVLPAVVENADNGVLAAGRQNAAPTKVVINPSHIEVVGVPERTVASAELTPPLALIAGDGRGATAIRSGRGSAR
jgi:hypothetical protein